MGDFFEKIVIAPKEPTSIAFLAFPLVVEFY